MSGGESKSGEYIYFTFLLSLCFSRFNSMTLEDEFQETLTGLYERRAEGAYINTPCHGRGNTEIERGWRMGTGLATLCKSFRLRYKTLI